MNKNSLLRHLVMLLLVSMTIQVNAQNASRNQNSRLNGKDNDKVSYTFYNRDKKITTASVTVLTGDSLSRYPTTNLIEALKGKIPSGLFSTTSYTPGGITTNINIRGLGVSTMIDGVSMSLGELDPMEIETITVTNGVTDRAVLGSNTKFNLLNVNTKRGKIGQNTLKVSVESGVKAIQHLPSWTSGYENALLYNQASLNDGLEPKYDDSFLESLKMGANTPFYPNENYFNHLFNSTGSFNRVGVSYSGGSDRTRYFVFMGYVNEGNNLLNYQDRNLNRFRIRGNFDSKISDIITLSVDFIGRYMEQKIPAKEDDIFTVISTYPSYALPIIAKNDPSDILYGRTPDYGINPVAQQTILGRSESRGQFSQNNIKLDIDLSGVTNGLSLTTGFNYNITTSVGYSRKNGYTFRLYEPIYRKDILGNDSLSYSVYGQDNINLATVRTSESIIQNFVAFANLDYQLTKGNHNLHANLVEYYRYYFPKDKGLVSTKNDLSLAVRYGYSDRYFADITMTYSQDNFLPVKNRKKVFPAFGAAWLVHNESFLSNANWLDQLKLRFNYGVIGSSDLTDYYISQTRYIMPPGRVAFGPSSSPTWYDAVNMTLVGNESLDWVLNKQLEIGLDAAILNDKLSMGLNVYRYTIDGIINTDISPRITGNSNKYTNIGANMHQGIDLGLTHTSNIGNFTYSAGVNFGFRNSRILRDNQIPYELPWMNRVGNRTDGFYGFVADGIFASQLDIDNSAKQFLGNIKTGDLKYRDLDGNAKVEPLVDQKMIGNSTPTYVYGVNVGLNYKNFSVYVQGSGVSDVDINVLGNTYFRPELRNKYSTFVANQLAKNEYPALTTYTNPNNSVLSSYWLIDGSYFKINNIELAYNITPSDYRLAKVIRNIKFYIRGSNLLTFSTVPELDPEAISAGISDYPSMKNITAGFSVDF